MTVLTNLDDDALSGIMTAYGFKAVTSIVGIVDGNHESTFMFRADGQEFILTVFESNVESLDLERAFAVMERLNSAGFACPRPLRDRAGNASIRAVEKLVAAVSFIPGVTSQADSVERCVDLGRHAARIHTLLPLRPVLEGSSLKRGYIHGALKPGNVFFIDQRVSGVINFRFVHEDCFIAELADVIVNWTVEYDGSLKRYLAQGILDGYQEVRPLGQDEIKSLPGFIFASSAKLFAIRDHSMLPDAPQRTMEFGREWLEFLGLA